MWSEIIDLIPYDQIDFEKLFEDLEITIVLFFINVIVQLRVYRENWDDLKTIMVRVGVE